MKFNSKLLITLLALGTLSMPTLAQIDTESIDVGKGASWEEQILVPYSDVEDVSLDKLLGIYQQTGISRYNIGFVVSDANGKPIWFEDRYTKDAREIDREVASGLKVLRNHDVDAMICFGGPKGDALYEKEDDADTLFEYYEDIIDMYDLTAADFYMKGTSFSKSEYDDVLKNIDALVELKEKNDELKIWLTFETDRNGVNQDIWDVIKYAIDEDLEFEGINFRVLEYKSDNHKAYEVVESVLENAYEELEELMPKLDEDEIWAAMGVTCTLDKENPQNFTVEDAKKVSKFVADNEMGYLGYYAVDQDTYEYQYAKVFAEALIAHQVPVNLKPIWVNSDEIIFEWDIIGDSGNIDFYRVYRQMGNQKRLDLVGTSKKMSYTDKDLEKDMEYTYYVSSVDSLGKESKNSQPLKIKTLKDNIEEIDVNKITDTDITKDSITFTWDKVEDAEYYEIYRNGLKIATTTEEKYTDTGLQPNTNYYYSIRAINKKDILIALSKEFEAKTKKADDVSVDVANFKGEWKPGTQYELNDIVSYKEILYICVQRNLALSDWQPSSTRALWNRVPGNYDLEDFEDEYDANKDKDKDKDKGSVITDLEELLDANGTKWAVGVEYKQGDVVLYNDKVYSCVQSHTAHGANWTPDAQPSLWGVYEVDFEDVKK